MDKLKEYFNQHRTSLYQSDEDLPAGDVDRLEGVYESYRHRIKFQSSLKRRKKSFWKVIAFPIVASLLLIAGIQILFGPASLTSSPQSDPLDMYVEYYENVAAITAEVAVMTAYMNEGQADRVMSDLESILSEPQEVQNVFQHADQQTQLKVIESFTTEKMSLLNDFLEKLKSNDINDN